MRIVFIDPMQVDYNVETVYQQPLGGMQSAAIYLAEALRARGHEIVYVSQTSQPGTYRGIPCYAVSSVAASVFQPMRLDACILVGVTIDPGNLRAVLGAGTVLTYWTGHDLSESAVNDLANPTVRDGLDGVGMVSQWQRARFIDRFSLDPMRTAVCRNAMAPAFENLITESTGIRKIKPAKLRLAYTSTPFRGLQILIDIFPALRSAIPDLELDVYSSMEVYRISAAEDEQYFGTLYNACRNTPGVNYRGAVSQKQLATELRNVHVLAYPNTYPETSCISVMEAMAAGCLVVTSDNGALPETTAGFADMVPLSPDPMAFRQMFARQLIDSLQRYQRGELDHRLSSAIAFVKDNYTWARRAAEWESWLGELLQRRQGNSARTNV